MSSSGAIDVPWSALRAALGGGLVPGVHAITGPVASGKTQLALQIAAAEGVEARLCHPSISPEEIRARVSGLRTRRPWSEVEPAPLPSRLEIAHAGAMEALARPSPVVLIDHPCVSEAGVLDAARALALRARSIVVLVAEPTAVESVRSFAPGDLLRRSPPEAAEWLGVHPRLAAEVDTLLALAPIRSRQDRSFSTVHVAIAKNRRGVPSWAALRFNGAWFEDETDLDLGL
jgi:hypothetical protein